MVSTLEERRQWAEQVAVSVDPDRLVARLHDAGWEIEDGRDGVYRRLRWPGTAGTLVVPLDRSAPEHVPLMAAVLVELDWAAERGRAAARILDRLRDGHS